MTAISSERRIGGGEVNPSRGMTRLTESSRKGQLPPMGNYQRTPEDLERELGEQIEELVARCQAFDQGTLWEAKSIATSIYKLVQDGRPPIRSLLGALGHKGSMQFLSTSIGMPADHSPHAPLTRQIADNRGTPSFQPLLDRGWVRQMMDFDSWWDEPVFQSESGEILTRHDLVFSMRSQDGGAHVDGSFKHDAYFQLSRGNNTTNTFAGSDGVILPWPNAHGATMRQMGEEIIESLKVVDLLR